MAVLTNTGYRRRTQFAICQFENIAYGSGILIPSCPSHRRNETPYGGEELSLMKPTAYLINTSRGPVVDEQALLDALRNRKIGGAGLDVYENEPALTPGLTELDNVILLPHIGSGTLETRIRMATMASDNLIAGLSGDVPQNLVNPEVLPIRRI